MNIFYLSQDPKEAARFHCDRHVIKMILESAQLLCTAQRLLGSDESALYKITHQNHPCAIWVRESASNYRWLFELMLALNDEYRFRYKKSIDHKSVWNLGKILGRLPPALEDIGPTQVRQAMPDEFRCADPVQAYRAYYNGAKRDLHKWTNREIPNWITG